MEIPLTTAICRKLMSSWRIAALTVIGFLILWVGRPTHNPAWAQSLPDVVERTERSVVRINVTVPPEAQGHGSGFVVDSSGIVATNFHVIQGAHEATVEFRDGQQAMVRGFYRVDPQSDLALIQIDRNGVDAIEVEDRTPRKGEQVFALGAPHGLDFSVTDGIVSAVRRLADVPGAHSFGRSDLLLVQTSAPISPGNSGGPLITKDGSVIGINTLVLATGQNLNFAVSSVELQKILKERPSLAQPLERLPRANNRHIASNDNAIYLPSGKTLDIRSMFVHPATDAIAESAYRELFKSQPIEEFKYPSGKWAAWAGHYEGVLHGPLVAFYELGGPSSIANYERGRLHGNLMTFNVAGKPVYFAQYINGREQGFVCFYKDGELRLIQEATRGKPEATYLIKAGHILQTLGDGQPVMPDDGEIASLLAELDRTQDTIKKNEREFKKTVRERDNVRRRRAMAEKGRIANQRASAKRRAQRAAATRAAAEQATRLRGGR